MYASSNRIKFGAILLFLLLPAAALHAWTMSVEFPFAALPRSVWEQSLTHLKDMGVTHVSLPSGNDPALDPALDDAIRIVRRLGLEADLEGPVPERMQALRISHGGPLTEPLAGGVRISATMPRALDNERKLLTSGTPAIIWTDAFETLIPGYQPGAITLAGGEGAGALLIRREARLARLWGASLAALLESRPESRQESLAESSEAHAATPMDSILVHQYVAAKPSGPPPALLSTLPSALSLTSVVNNSSDTWKGDIAAMYPAAQRPIVLPGVAVAPYDVLWLPVDVPLTPGPLCIGCIGFATTDHLIYATAELTDMEYENGILAMEFISRSPGEVVLQLSHEPIGPLVAGGRPAEFDWEAKTQRVRLPIPAGNAKTGRVRVALAIDGPPETAFFETASVLLIGETARLWAEYSPPGVAARSRVRTIPEMAVSREEAANPVAVSFEDKDKPALIAYKITIPPTSIAGDTAQLTIDADGLQLSHSQLRLLAPAVLSFPDAVTVELAANSELTVSPATIPVNQKSGREIVLSIHNNAPEIRTFDITPEVAGLEFSPEKIHVTVGESLARDVTFRVFSAGASAGVHEGTVKVSGAATLAQAVRFVVLPPDGPVEWSADGLSFLENTKYRASFLPNRWLEMIDKESGKDSLPVGGVERPISAGSFPRLEELQQLAPHSR